MNIPVSVIGGYLGAGKTTVVNQMLRQNMNSDTPRKIAVLVNEFGELPIDADLIVGEKENVVAIAGGCICCAYGNDLTSELIKLGHRETKPDNVIIEASGVAIPNRIAGAVSLLQGFENEKVIVLVDGGNIKKQFENSFIVDTLERQLQSGDMIVLNKCDGIDETQKKEIKKILENKIGNTKIIETEYGKLENNVIFNCENTREYKDDGGESHNPFVSFNFSPLAVVDVERLAQSLADNPNVIRAKGFGENDKGELWNLQIVEAEGETKIVGEEKNIETGIVVMGVKNQIDETIISKIIEECKI